MIEIRTVYNGEVLLNPTFIESIKRPSPGAQFSGTRCYIRMASGEEHHSADDFDVVKRKLAAGEKQ